MPTTQVKLIPELQPVDLSSVTPLDTLMEESDKLGNSNM